MNYEALFEIYTWILCLSYLHEKQTSTIQSLYSYFIKIVPFWLRNILFFNTKHPVIILRASLFVVTNVHRLMSLHGKLNVKIFLMFIVAENTRSVNIYTCDGTYMYRWTDEEDGPTVWLPWHRYFAGFFNRPVQAPTWEHPFYGDSEKSPFTTCMVIRRIYSRLKPPGSSGVIYIYHISEMRQHKVIRDDNHVYKMFK